MAGRNTPGSSCSLSGWRSICWRLDGVRTAQGNIKLGGDEYHVDRLEEVLVAHVLPLVSDDGDHKDNQGGQQHGRRGSDASLVEASTQRQQSCCDQRGREDRIGEYDIERYAIRQPLDDHIHLVGVVARRLPVETKILQVIA